MKFNRIIGIALLTFIVGGSCRTTTVTEKKKKMNIIVVDAPLLAPSHPAVYPIVVEPELPPSEPAYTFEEDFNRKPISSNFSYMEKEHVKATDPMLFSNGKDEIIYLSHIREGEYAFPLPGAKVISPYGGQRRNHSGIDLKTRPNDTIVAAFDGVVRMSKPYSGYGNIIVIRHYNGLETAYSHNSRNLVKSGDLVKAGQPIALTGRTGRATTEHLHFETRINGVHFNPTLLFDFNTQTLHKSNLICSKRDNTITVRSSNAYPQDLKAASTKAVSAKTRPSNDHEEDYSYYRKILSGSL